MNSHIDTLLTDVSDDENTHLVKINIPRALSKLSEIKIALLFKAEALVEDIIDSKELAIVTTAVVSLEKSILEEKNRDGSNTIDNIFSIIKGINTPTSPTQTYIDMLPYEETSI